MTAIPPDHFKELMVDHTTSPKTLKKTFHRLAWKLHPDRNPEKEAQEKFKRVSDAYGVLSDPEKRTEYLEQVAEAERVERRKQQKRENANEQLTESIKVIVKQELREIERQKRIQQTRLTQINSCRTHMQILQSAIHRGSFKNNPIEEYHRMLQMKTDLERDEKTYRAWKAKIAHERKKSDERASYLYSSLSDPMQLYRLTQQDKQFLNEYRIEIAIRHKYESQYASASQTRPQTSEPQSRPERGHIRRPSTANERPRRKQAYPEHEAKSSPAGARHVRTDTKMRAAYQEAVKSRNEHVRRAKEKDSRQHAEERDLYDDVYSARNTNERRNPHDPFSYHYKSKKKSNCSVQ